MFTSYAALQAQVNDHHDALLTAAEHARQGKRLRLGQLGSRDPAHRSHRARALQLVR